ncbi:TPA: hypothetical protein EYP66_06165 [Candidatus Poribacteria bacterium]|nr:hypothetical protein [Candidatus Poribacteria bacterium]
MRYLLVVMMAAMLATTASAYNWEVAEIGGADSEQGPYEGGTVDLLGPDGFVVTAKGGDIWGNLLGCTLVYIPGVAGDFTIQYTVEEHTGDPPTTWTKVGAMVAQDIEPDTPYVFLASMPSNDPTALNDKGCKIISRPERGGGAGPGSDGFAPLQWPVTYKLVREGDLFTGSLSFDGGKTWQSIAAPEHDKTDNQTVVFEDPVILGIAINGHNAGQTTGTAKITNIKITGGGVTPVEPAGKASTTWAAVKQR